MLIERSRSRCAERAPRGVGEAGAMLPSRTRSERVSHLVPSPNVLGS